MVWITGIFFDHFRAARIGLPETVLCEGNPFDALVELLSHSVMGPGILFCSGGLRHLFLQKCPKRSVMAP
jgi:hypothetical protein